MHFTRAFILFFHLSHISLPITTEIPLVFCDSVVFFYRLDLKLFGFLSDFQILNLNTSNPSTLYQLYVLIASSPQIGFSTFIRSFYFSRIFRMDFITKLYQFPLKSPFGKKISLLFCCWNPLIVFLNPTLTNHLHTDLLARCCLLIYHIYTVYGSWSEWIT